jgi:hypothetical protein
MTSPQQDTDLGWDWVPQISSSAFPSEKKSIELNGDNIKDLLTSSDTTLNRHLRIVDGICILIGNMIGNSMFT